MLLFLWEARKSRAIIRSRDISYAFTNVSGYLCEPAVASAHLWLLASGQPCLLVLPACRQVMAQNYYSLKSYDHFCFFSQIDNSKKKKDE